jgi:RNA polymerase sigma-70 factor (ECF subfamily)
VILDEPSEDTAAPGPVAFEELHAILVRVVRRICPAWMAGQQDDLVQIACLRIVKKCPAGEEFPAMGTSYLWKVAHSVVMDELRRRRRHPEVELDRTSQVQHASSRPTPEADRARSELNTAITAGLGRLNEARRWAVMLYLYGFSLKDSARMLGWNAKRVDNQRYQGLSELRAYLKERGLEP